MPGSDGTGPMGTGPSGRGLGGCLGAIANWGRGMGFGFGRGMGRGRGYGMGFGFGRGMGRIAANPQLPAANIDPDQLHQMADQLEKRAAYLRGLAANPTHQAADNK